MFDEFAFFLRLDVSSTENKKGMKGKLPSAVFCEGHSFTTENETFVCYSASFWKATPACYQNAVCQKMNSHFAIHKSTVEHK